MERKINKALKISLNYNFNSSYPKKVFATSISKDGLLITAVLATLPRVLFSGGRSLSEWAILLYLSSLKL
jgi:hypothetical protein